MNLDAVRTIRPKQLPVNQENKRLNILAHGFWRWFWIVLLLWLMVVWYLINYRWPRLLSADVNIYLAQPLMWTSVTVLAYLGWRFGLASRPPMNKRLVIMAVLIGLFQVAIFVITGLIFGFGHSPYGHRPLVLLGNILYVVTMLVGVEMSRAYLVRIFSQGNLTVSLLVSSYSFWFLSIPVAKFASIYDLPTVLRVSGETFLPLGAENLLASFLALIGGPITSIAYRGALQAFEWLSPILPNPHWTVTAFVGTMAPILGMLIIRSQFLSNTSDGEESPSREAQTSTSWILVGVVAVTMLWFNTGIFGVQPTLVSGVSMEPTLKAGDVVITRDIPTESVAVGDIIRFRDGGSYIVHRVVKIQNEAGEIQFITRGDANNTLDPPVRASQLEGKVVLTVPKVGWVSIGIRKIIEWLL